MQALEIDIALLARCLSHMPLEKVLQLEEQQETSSLADATDLVDPGKPQKLLGRTCSLPSR